MYSSRDPTLVFEQVLLMFDQQASSTQYLAKLDHHITFSLIPQQVQSPGLLPYKSSYGQLKWRKIPGSLPPDRASLYQGPMAAFIMSNKARRGAISSLQRQ
ncbi:hypothetical protein GB937_009780 [Aspergillus fischeri]|nr:hypothetical protein GB937_009780 [Aspergillus fischeri]